MPLFTEEQNRSIISMLGLKSKFSSTSSQAMFHCCFHSGDNTPSLSINFSKGLFYCFGCQKKGTISRLVKEVTGKSMSSILGIEKDFNVFSAVQHIPYIPQKPITKDVFLDIRGVFNPFDKSDKAIKYLTKRYISWSVAQKMNMQYTVESFINGTHFVDRLLIPIYDETKKIVNIEGRDVTFQQTLKCLYPAKASKPIYEWYILNKEKPLYVFEGLIKMAVARSDPFFENSTATLGSRVSEFQMEQLKLFKKVVVIPDNDEAGERMTDEIKRRHSNVSIMKIRNQQIKDVDEIPGVTGKTVEQYRIEGGFSQELSF